MIQNREAFKRKIVQSMVLVILASGLLFLPEIKVPVMDDRAENYFNAAIQKAGIAYATVRVLNASISVIQHSQLQLEPAGVGMSIAVGQVLDPIDDITERLSSILVTAIASLGIQKLIHEMAVVMAPPVLAFLCIFLFIGIWVFKDHRHSRVQNALHGLIAIILVGRFFLPVSAHINDILYQRFFLQDISEARQGLMLISSELVGLQEIQMPKVDGFAETIKNSGKFLEQTGMEIKTAIGLLKQNMGKTIDNLLTLIRLYLGIFIIQVIALPVLMFWFLTKLASGLLMVGFPSALGQVHAASGTNGD